MREFGNDRERKGKRGKREREREYRTYRVRSIEVIVKCYDGTISWKNIIVSVWS